MFISHCGIDCWNESMELSDVVDYRYLLLCLQWTYLLVLKGYIADESGSRYLS